MPSRNASPRMLASYRGMFPRLLQLVDEMNLSQSEAAAVLTNEGFRTERGNAINQSLVCRCLTVAESLRDQGKLGALAEGARLVKIAAENAKSESPEVGFLREAGQQRQEENQALRALENPAPMLYREDPSPDYLGSKFSN